MPARFALILAMFAAGCGGSTATDTGTTDDTGAAADTSTTTDGSSDTSTPSDGTTSDTGTAPTDSGTTGDASSTDAKGVDCNGKTCASDEVCCASAGMGGATFTCTKGSCPDGGATISCDGPEDCTGGSVCCGEVDIGGMIPSCTFKSAAASCAPDCKTSIPLTCPGTGKVRPCHTAADCPESGYANCCQFSGGGSSGTFCVSDALKFGASKCF